MTMSNKAPKRLRQVVSGKILTEEAISDGGWVFVSTRVLAVLDSEGEIRVQRPWHEVAIGEWDDSRNVMTVQWVDGDRPLRVRTENPHPINFPRIFKERVDASVVYAETVPVPGGFLRGALRRTPEGELISQISSDGELPNSPDLEERIKKLEAKLWEFVGI